MTDLFAHQKAAVEFIIANNGCGALWHEMGLGKTRAALEVYTRLRAKNPHLKMVVICPLSLIDAAWGEDIKKFTNYVYRNCHDDGIRANACDIYIINYEALISSANEWRLIDLLKANDCFVCLDESSKIKNFKSITTKKILFLRDHAKHRVVMSGTPAPNSETEYWPQLAFVDESIFPKSFYAFRNQYFHLTRGKQTMPSGSFMSRESASKMFSQGWKYAITDKKRAAMIKTMAPWCHYAKKAECMDLPEQLDEKRLVTMKSDQQRAYNQMKNDCFAEIASMPVVASVALAKVMKLRQITSGFAITPEGVAVSLPENPKMTEFKNLIEELGAEQAIIWCQFHWEIKKIKDFLGDKAVCLYGETENKAEPVAEFKSGEAQYLIAHPRSAAHGLTLTNCNVEIFYSLDYSWEMYEQARGRIHRSGQTRKCTNIHLLCANSIDEIILDVLKNKKATEEILYRMMKNETSA